MKLSAFVVASVALLAIAPLAQAFVPSFRNSGVAAAPLFYKDNSDIGQDEAGVLKAGMIVDHYPASDDVKVLNRLLTTVAPEFTPSPHRPIEILLEDLADGIFDRIILSDNTPTIHIDKATLRQHFDQLTSGKNTADQAEEYVDIVLSVLLDSGEGLIHREDMRGAFQKHDFRPLYETLTGMAVDDRP